ncbi:unnamed protein product [Arctogadus glacialis]
MHIPVAWQHRSKEPIGATTATPASWACTEAGRARRLGVHGGWACTEAGHARRLGVHGGWACTEAGCALRLVVHGDWACMAYAK